MIKKIKRIKNFGVFNDFTQQTDVKDFAKYNLIYGWNYAGKTTLSRIFRCFEQECIPSDFQGASFEFIDSNDNLLSDQYLEISHAVRVFNSDFVEDNLKWNNDLEPIFLIGQDNIELQNELVTERENSEMIGESVNSIRKSIEEIEKSISDALTSKARDVKQTLSLPDYNKTKLQTKLLFLKDKSNDFLLNTDEYSETIANYFSIEKREHIAAIKELSFDTNKLSEMLDNLLATTVISKTIDRLKDNTDIQVWVKTGLHIHDAGSSCEFCGGVITQNLIDKLNAHFSDDYNKFIKDIDYIIDVLKRKDPKYIFTNSSSLYPELKDRYVENISILEEKILDFNNQIDALIATLIDKKNKPFESLPKIPVIDYTEEINVLIGDINFLIQEHNSKTDNFENIKHGNLEKLINYNAAKFIIDTEYFQKVEHKNQSFIALNAVTSNLGVSKARVQELELLLSESIKGADKINEHIKTFFGKDDLKINVGFDNKFQLLRRGNVAKNLSEGEKTAIAFAYFVTKLEDKNTVLKDTIIYLDDPISSLDSNHIFNIYAFIKTKLSSCKQLFISTHNSEFFNIIKDWYGDHKKNQKAVFLVERATNSSVDKSYIKNIPLLMDKYKSEYVYLFSVINDFKNGPTTDFHMLYNLPNLMRRFLESYVSFKIPKSAGLNKKLELLIKDQIKLEKVTKFVHQNSHTSSISSGMQFPNLTECSDVITLIFEMIIDKDKDHYDYLLEAVSDNSDQG